MSNERIGIPEYELSEETIHISLKEGTLVTQVNQLFQLSLITVFTALLSLGTMGVNTALANHNELEGKIVLKETCDHGIGTKPSKRTIKSNFEMRFMSAKTNHVMDGDYMPFPNWSSSTLFIESFNGPDKPPLFLFGREAVARSMNGKKGTFYTVMDDDISNIQGVFVLSLRGTVTRNKNNDPEPGDAKSISGKITGYDNFLRCTYTGKFKGKRCPLNACPNAGLPPIVSD
jgi:hypothetical protein